MRLYASSFRDRRGTGIYTISANLAGIPGISISCGFTKSGLPIGLQILAAPFEEEKLLRIAPMFERATDWHTHRPKLEP
jgi:aspartyl-tRNA(Asn)/glutamyl-tRNA(Gln) amidotransferase subunit A